MLVLVGLLLAVLVATIIWPWQREPEYKGLTLSKWAEARPGDSRGATEAVRQMGTNALPWLVKWVVNEPLSPWQSKVLKIVAKFPTRMGGGYAQKSLSGFERQRRARLAWDGLHFLGPDARAAVPDLVKMASDSRYAQSGKTAVTILSGIGEEAVPGLLAILRKPQAPGRRSAIGYFHTTHTGDLGTNKNAAADALVLCLEDIDWHTRGDAAMALGNSSFRPETVISALVKSAEDPKGMVKICSLQALAEFGELARPATPVLLRALKDPDSGVRLVAAFALDQIAPEAKPADAGKEL
jgi:HEAT repeat protein